MAENKEPSTVADVLKLQADLRARFESRLSKEGFPRNKKPEEIVELRGEDLDRAKAALAEAESQRAAVGKYWDERVARLRARVERQGDEMKAAKELAKSIDQKPAAPKAAVSKAGDLKAAVAKSDDQKVKPAAKKK